MYCASASRHRLSHSSGSALSACTTEAVRSAGAATGTKFSVAGASSAASRRCGAPATAGGSTGSGAPMPRGERHRWQHRDDHADHLDPLERVHALGDELLVPLLR